MYIPKNAVTQAAKSNKGVLTPNKIIECITSKDKNHKLSIEELTAMLLLETSIYKNIDEQINNWWLPRSISAELKLDKYKINLDRIHKLFNQMRDHWLETNNGFKLIEIEQ